jgi:alkylation response protein AidB-like acyl-CoA dehydrogenase
VHEAFRKADLLAIQVPEEYGGAGADAVSGRIRIEEVARVCAASRLIPLGNKLGTTGMILPGTEDLKARYLPLVARGEATFAYALPSARRGRMPRRCAPAHAATATATC